MMGIPRECGGKVKEEERDRERKKEVRRKEVKDKGERKQLG